jgi:probable DNA metabolism protein
MPNIRRISLFTWIYDGTFEGFLTVCSLGLDQKETIAAITTPEDFQPDLFSKIREAETDPLRADRFFQLVNSQFTRSVVLDCGYCFLSELPGIEKTLFDYFHLLFTAGEKAGRNSADSTALRVRRTSDKVNHEILRMQGLVRFRQLAGGVYYAAIEPDYNILQFLAPHFAARFADQLWLIHDVKRKIGIYYDLRSCSFLPSIQTSPEVPDAAKPLQIGESRLCYAAGEGEYQALWNQYFQSIAIAERANPKAQRQRMPVRYWRYLVEELR